MPTRQAAERIAATMDLADWRAQINALYARIRETSEPRAAWADWRDTRDRLFSSHSQSPIAQDARAGYGGVPVFDYDSDWRFEVALDRPAHDEVVVGEIGADGSIGLRPVARTNGLQAALGKELTVYWIEGYGGGLFVPFKDATAGTETYGGGRYILDAIKGADLGRTETDRLVLDFNFAYHPSCAHSPDWACPLAPPANLVDVPIRAGERL